MKEQLELNGGFIETRELDSQGNPNGDYWIEKGDKCYEYGTLKNGQKDGIVEKYTDGDEDKMVPEYYKDGKKQILLSAALRAAVVGQKFISQQERQNEEAILDYKTRVFVGKEMLKEFLDKLAKWAGVDRFRESFVPIKTNEEGREFASFLQQNKKSLNTQVRAPIIPKAGQKFEKSIPSKTIQPISLAGVKKSVSR